MTNITTMTTKMTAVLRAMHLLPLIALLLVLSGCKQKKTDAEAKLTPEEQAAIKAEVAERVNAIYADVFGAYRKHADDLAVPSFDNEHYLASDYLRTFRAVQQKDAQLEGEVGFFDHDHWIQAQDWSTDLSMHIDSMHVVSPTFVATWITIHNDGTDTPLLLEMAPEGKTWCINDFISLDEEKLSQYTLESAPMEKFQMKLYLGDEGIKMMTEMERANYDEITKQGAEPQPQPDEHER